jgi:hypothetical protein
MAPMADRRVAPQPGTASRTFGGGRPTAIVVHSLEAPPKPGMAFSLATGWLQGANVSIHSITDPGESVDMVDLQHVASHCGGGNPYTIGNEHTGYAAYTRDQWTSDAVFPALRLGAKKAAAQAKALGWSAADLRWLSIPQLKAGERGLATHNDCRLAFGGTTHTDPGPGFPYAIFLQMVQEWFGAPVDSSGTPNPTEPGVGGAQSWFDGVSTAEWLGTFADALA